MHEHILIEGARQNNLKGFTVRIPRNALTVVTGLSGSGKSSLAFDTLYAEGQRKYVESLSAYARQFLDQMQKPDVDHIDGLSPAIAIEQRSAGSNPRSIVATTTEVHDYLRLLYASVGHPHCPKCGRPVSSQSAEQMVDQLLTRPEGTRVTLLAPLVEGRKGEHLEILEDARHSGFTRVEVDGQLYELDDVPALDKKRKHSIYVVVDRLILKDGIRSRLTDSVELALRTGGGILRALFQSDAKAESVPVVFSEKNACPHCGLSFEPLQARHFSFNSPYGACPVCNGLGTMLVFDPDLCVPDPSRSIDDGAIVAWRPSGRHEAMYRKALLRSAAAHYGFSLDTPWKDLPESARDIILHGSGDEPVPLHYWRRGARHTLLKPFEGVIPNLTRRFEETDSDFMRQKLSQFQSRLPCSGCHGKRLRPESLAATVDGLSIMDLMAMPATDALAFCKGLPARLTPQEATISHEILKEICRRLQFLVDVGLGYLNLDRESSTLSGGEAQRIRLATQVGAGLVGVLYVLDEPSIGLHQRDNEKLLSTLKGLRDAGNTVVVVEHDEQTIREADYVIDLGPGAGVAGGNLVFAGTVPELMKSRDSLTAQYLRGEKTIPVPAARVPAGPRWLEVVGASENNLQNVHARFPLGAFTCVTGVSGSGKSSLVNDILWRELARRFYRAKTPPGRFSSLKGVQQIDKVIVIDQSPIGRTPRSNPATYTGVFDEIRHLYAQLPSAKVRGYGPGRFSFNVKGGRCEACKGDGLIKIEMNFLPDVYVPCAQCHGRRYNLETLDVKWHGKTIADVLDMTIDEAIELFSSIPRIARKLQTLSDVGLGYLKVGQPATTLSGGEAQRMKLSAELARKDTGNTLYLLDEPTTGLHFDDVARLLRVLLRLRDAGNTLIIIEHNLDVIKTADYIIDLGPEGGADGGRIVAEGTPEHLVADCQSVSHTARFLAPLLGAKSTSAPKPTRPPRSPKKPSSRRR